MLLSPRRGSLLILFACAALTGLQAQPLPPPVASGEVTLEVHLTGEDWLATYDYEPPSLRVSYAIKAEKLAVAVGPKTTTTRTDTTIPAVPAAAGETTISYNFEADYESKYLAAHPGAGLIKPSGGWVPGWSAVVPYSQITLKTTWDATGQPAFELNAVQANAGPARLIKGTGWGAMFSQFGAPASLPVTIPASTVTQASAGIGWFRRYPPAAEYRFLEGTAYYFTQLQPDGTTTVHHINSYTVPVADIREFYPIGEVKVTGTPGHGASPASQSTSYNSTTEPLTSGGAYFALTLDSNALTFSDDKFELTTEPTADYAFAPTGASASKLRYKLVIQPGLARTITWAETFTPAGATEPSDYNFLSETVTAEATETLPHTIDPFDTANPHRHGSTPGQYALLFFEGALTVDTNHDGAIVPSVSPVTPYSITHADSGALGADLSFRPNQNNDVDPADPANTTNGLDFENSQVDGVDDLQSFVPVFLAIGQLLKQLPPTNGFTYKLKQADSALNFVYTNLTQVTAFFYLTNPDTGSGYGPAFGHSARNAPTEWIKAGGVDIFGGATGSVAFRDLAVRNKGAVILIEARQATDQPLVLEVSRGATVVAEVQLALSIFSPQLIVDANRDGVINTADFDTASPYRFWINDNHELNAAKGLDYLPSSASDSPDYANTVVDSVRDLVDFFPVYLDLKQYLAKLPAGLPVKCKLVHAGAALNFAYTALHREQALDYEKTLLATGFGDTFTQAPGEATTHQITATGYELSSTFITGIQNSDWGVILVECSAATSAPLILRIEKEDGTLLAETQLSLKIGPVEDMFRHLDLTHLATEYDGTPINPPKFSLPTQMDAPPNLPDSMTNGKYFVFVHGYNVDGDSARGWNAQVFKRLHVLGSKARFVGVSWNGTPQTVVPGRYPDYHKAVFNAFNTGDLLKSQLALPDGTDVMVAVHSLGNMVVSQAIQYGGFTPARYYMINAAVALEAYDPESVTTDQIAAMTEESWEHRDSRFFAANWHDLFQATPSDHRNELTWRERFPNVLSRVYQFYSPGDDVVQNPTSTSSNVIWDMFINWDVSRGAWGHQEMIKGSNLLSSGGGSLFFSRKQAGWNRNFIAYPPLFLPDANDPAVLEGLKTTPLFERFLEDDLMNADPTIASVKAGEVKVQYDLLARALPALSYAAAVNPIIAVRTRSPNRIFDMETNGRTQGQWPAENHPGISSGRWLHSDFKNVALPYVHQMYDEMISKGSLK